MLGGFGFVLKSLVLCYFIPQCPWTPGCEALEHVGSSYGNKTLSFASFNTANLKKEAHPYASLCGYSTDLSIKDTTNTMLQRQRCPNTLVRHQCVHKAYPHVTNTPLQSKKAQRRQARVTGPCSSGNNTGCDCPQVLQGMLTLFHQKGELECGLLDKQLWQLSASAGRVCVCP